MDGGDDIGTGYDGGSEINVLRELRYLPDICF